MRYCPTCDEEYKDNIERCADDDTPLVDRATWEAKLAREGRNPIDAKTLAAIAVFENRFEADELAQDLADAGFDVEIVASRPSTLGSLTTAVPTTWSIVVPDREKAKALPLVNEWRAALESSQGEAERAAEAEEAETESEKQ